MGRRAADAIARAKPTLRRACARRAGPRRVSRDGAGDVDAGGCAVGVADPAATTSWPDVGRA
jgi:hypothetical protein